MGWKDMLNPDSEKYSTSDQVVNDDDDNYDEDDEWLYF